MRNRVARRGLHAALPMLLHALNDPDSNVRDEAAGALRRIGDPRTGYDLFKRYVVEDDLNVRKTLSLGLGSTGYRPAVPLLIDALTSEDHWLLRAHAAMALADLGATEALPALRQALAQEADDWVKGWMRDAIEELERG